MYFMEKIYGYVRVSSKEQNEDRQLITMKEMGVPEENIYVDKQSGKDFNRPEYRKLIKKIRKGDVLYIKSIDRFGRNYNEIMEQWRVITKVKEADIVVMDMPLLDTRSERNLMGTFVSDLVLQILSFVAENERRNIKQRQSEGIAAARVRGVKFGRTSNVTRNEFLEIYRKWIEKEIDAKTAAKFSKVSLTTFYRKGKRIRKEMGM